MNNVVRVLVFILITATSIYTSMGQENSTQFDYSFKTQDEARRELTNPAPTVSPTNAEIFKRFDAINQSTNSSPTALAALRSMGGQYNLSLAILDSSRQDKDQGSLEANAKSSLKALQWQVEIPKTIPCGSPIPLSVALKNISDNEIALYSAPMSPAFALSSIELNKVDKGSVKVKMTKLGIRRFYSGWIHRYHRITPVSLMPGDACVFHAIAERSDGKISLSRYFDLSEPGEYELTFYTRRFIDENGNPAEDQELEYPRKATVRFTVLPKSEDEE